MDSSLLTLPPHLLERIVDILRVDVDLPRGLRLSLEAAKGEAEGFSALPTETPTEDGEQRQDDKDESDETFAIRPEAPVIEIAIVEKLAKWSASNEGAHRIRKAKLDPNDYTLISLLAGTQVYIPPSKLSLLESSTNPDNPNPYLPSHLSVRPAPLSGYRALNKQMSMVLNVLFSIGGSGGAVYVASVTGAGYSRETGVILGVLAAMVVGLAELVLAWIFIWRVGEGRKKEVEQWKGSASLGVKEREVLALENDVNGEGKVDEGDETAVPEKKAEVRLRRRAIRPEVGET